VGLWNVHDILACRTLMTPLSRKRRANRIPGFPNPAKVSRPSGEVAGLLIETRGPCPVNEPYSITYVDSPAGHVLPEPIETRKGHKDAPNSARAPEIELVQATQS
jgi:hypothetical protein